MEPVSRAKGKAGQGGRGQNSAKRADKHRKQRDAGKVKRKELERRLRKHLEDSVNSTYLRGRGKQVVKEVRVRYGVVA
jgi:hypothetical protein